MTRPVPPALMVTPAAGPVIVSALLSSTGVSYGRLMVCGVLNAVGSKLIVFAPDVKVAWLIAHSSVPGEPSSAVLSTVNVESSSRPSSASRTGFN